FDLFAMLGDVTLLPCYEPLVMFGVVAAALRVAPFTVRSVVATFLRVALLAVRGVIAPTTLASQAQLAPCTPLMSRRRHERATTWTGKGRHLHSASVLIVGAPSRSGSLQRFRHCHEPR